MVARKGGPGHHTRTPLYLLGDLPVEISYSLAQRVLFVALSSLQGLDLLSQVGDLRL